MPWVVQGGKHYSNSKSVFCFLCMWKNVEKKATKNVRKFKYCSRENIQKKKKKVAIKAKYSSVHL